MQVSQCITQGVTRATVPDNRSLLGLTHARLVVGEQVWCNASCINESCFDAYHSDSQHGVIPISLSVIVVFVVGLYLIRPKQTNDGPLENHSLYTTKV